jgi:MFS family permease
MTDVAQGWLMTTLAASPLTVALLTTAESLPIFLLSLPAGAIADIVDRRRLLIMTQALMALIAGTLVATSAAGLVTPGILLALAAAMGVAAAANNPAWLAVTPEIVPREDLAAAVTLNSVRFNIARIVGPALGGIVVGALGPSVAFGIDALSFLVVVFVLIGWRREAPVTVLPAERLMASMKAGLRFARHSPPLRRVLLHAFGFVSCASIVLTLLPVLARETGGSPSAYGALLGSMGVGAVIATFVLPRLRARHSSDAILVAGGLLFAAGCAGMALAHSLRALVPAFVVCGFAWMSVLSTLNVAAQTVAPGWVRARALAVYLLVFQAGFTGASAGWGAIATQWGMGTAFLGAAALLAVVTVALARLRISADERLDFTPSRHWPKPTVVGEPDLEAGPVLVELEYRIDPARAAAFIQAARELERIRRRDGAFEWWLLRDASDPALYVETFAVETWAEHLRQHERVSASDRAIEDRVIAFHTGSGRPPSRHLLATDANARAPDLESPQQPVTGSVLLSG